MAVLVRLRLSFVFHKGFLLHFTSSEKGYTAHNKAETSSMFSYQPEVQALSQASKRKTSFLSTFFRFTFISFLTFGVSRATLHINNHFSYSLLTQSAC